MCERSKAAPMGHSTFRPLDHSSDKHVYSALLVETHIDALHTLGVHPICNQFWQYPLCTVYWLWQPDQLHQLFMDLVKDILHCLLQYLKARKVKDQLDDQFTSVQWYPGLQCFSAPFESLKSGPWQGKEIHDMIRTLAATCTPLLVCLNDDWKSAAETASDEMVMRAVWVLCEFSLLGSQPNDSDLALKALDDALKWFYHKKGVNQEQKMSKSANGKVDEQLARESHQLREQKIDKICSAMRSVCMGLKMSHQLNEVNFRCASIEPNKQQQNGQMGNDRRQRSDWIVKAIRWHLSNVSI